MRFSDASHRNQHWKNVVAKHGGFNTEILAHWDTEREAFDHEILLIACFLDMGYKLANKSLGGEGASGYKYTEEQLKNRRGEKNGMFGRKRPVEEINKISEQTRKQMAAKGLTHKITIDGKTFNSKRELARFLGVHHRTVNDWSDLGILEEKYRARMA
jgi:hypothetical protein